MRRSPFIEVRFISPDSAAGSQTWLASPILDGMMSTSTENRPPALMASTMAFTKAVAVAIRHGVHRILHDVGALLVDHVELVGVQRGLVVIAGPDVMNAALALDQQLVDIGGGPADMGIGGTHIAFLVAAHAHAAAAIATDIAGGERDVHERGIGAIVVVAPDQAFLVGEHGASTLAVLGLGDPGRRLT